MLRRRSGDDDRSFRGPVPADRLWDDYKAQWTRFKKTYVDLARRYPEGYRVVERA
jgi:hypothetical protein